ncbi:hypothetical protein [Corynebacterium kozikiae]|uniref:hypothetical protein n=1 Tax=Corynebacterium kozikiae TaxID=2968469 RepID=UPI00211C5294|nr:hypothetical protein [Corynebacterium sp. 76QC2CO]MCQ9344006.1 hypothetical protein [Corynebacterium sp. 76QC2CO]
MEFEFGSPFEFQDVDTAAYFDKTAAEARPASATRTQPEAALLIEGNELDPVEEWRHGNVVELDEETFTDPFEFTDVSVQLPGLTISLIAPERYVITEIRTLGFSSLTGSNLEELLSSDSVYFQELGTMNRDGFTEGGTVATLDVPEDVKYLTLNVSYNYHPESELRQEDGNYSVYLLHFT